MKKNYSAPEIMFEDFVLSTSLAACRYSAQFAENSCAWDDPRDHFEFVVFTNDITACVYKAQDGKYNGICYHNPSDDCNVFSS